MTNGLGSPACGSPLGVELGALTRRDCETSGFTAAGAPTPNFGLDVHIDTGLIPLSGGSLLSTVQDMFITPAWLALVWLVHALVVMLEWSFGLDLLEGVSSRTLQASLSRASAALTAPFLPLALSVAAALVAYHGLVRRRVGQTLGEALAMLAMIGGGAWLIVDPAGTVGTLSSWSGEAGLGALAVAARGEPSAPGRALADSMSAVFAAAIETPWCYLEFGNVGWCRETARLERGLRLAGLRIADRELREANCAGTGSTCGASAAAAGLLGSARLLREARSNGDLFLALPPNGPDRNSINNTSSLLRVLCRSSDATACTGPGAAEAEFRTNSGTWPRVGGLLLIVIGLAGMVLLLGYIGLRLLLAAILSVFYLLLTPGIMLAPALGEGGRGLFRGWAGRLLGAVAAKLLFAFLLGAVLAVMSVLDGLQALGWWAQWLLLSAFWWGVFLTRHEILARTPQPSGGGDLGVQVRRIRKWRQEHHDRHEGRDRRNREREEHARRPEASWGRRRRDDTALARGGGHSLPGGDAQARRLLASQHVLGGAEKRVALAGLASSRSQLERIRRGRRAAVAAGDGRRAARLAAREVRVESTVAQQSAELARSAAAAAHRDGRQAASELEWGAGLLDRQAQLPAALERKPGERRRDYPAVAGVAGIGEDRYRKLDRQSQRKARLAIDRELNARRRQRGLRRVGTTPSSEQHEPPDRAESPVMRDARAVAEGRKRELGFGKP